MSPLHASLNIDQSQISDFMTHSSDKTPSSLVATHPRNIKIGALSLDIISTGGHYTCIQIPDKKIVVDMGVCPQNAITSNHVLFTHPHIDHMSAVMQHVSTREMLSLKNTNYYIEEQHRENFESMMNAWRKLSFCALSCSVTGMEPHKKQEIGKGISVTPFRSVHRIPCLGYIFSEQKKKLLPEYQGCSSDKIIQARKQNKEVTYTLEENILSVTGDTTHHVFEQNPSIFNSKVIVTEVTFFCDKILPEKAQKRGHMHIYDLLPYEEQLQDTTLVIMHVSTRYSTSQVNTIVHNTLPKNMRENLIIVPHEHILR